MKINGKYLIYFDESQLLTIKRALIIYEKKLPSALRGKGFFIDVETFKTDIVNLNDILYEIDEKLERT